MDVEPFKFLLLFVCKLSQRGLMNHLDMVQSRVFLFAEYVFGSLELGCPGHRTTYYGAPNLAICVRVIGLTLLGV